MITGESAHFPLSIGTAMIQLLALLTLAPLAVGSPLENWATLARLRPEITAPIGHPAVLDPPSAVAYLKTHKTASSTFGHILHRYAARRGLSIFQPHAGHIWQSEIEAFARMAEYAYRGRITGPPSQFATPLL